MKKAFYLSIFAILTYSNAFCGTDPDSLKSNSPLVSTVNKPAKEQTGSFNIKTSPAFFWKTIVLEIEAPIGGNFSIGLNLYGKLGRTDGKNANYKVKNQDFLSNGMRAEIAVKYYVKGTAPEGFYIQGNFGYNQIVYSDGTTRPYTLNSHTGVPDTNSKGEALKPYPFSEGLGIGYQLIVIPKHLIGNIMFGAQGNKDALGKSFVSFYISPSIGYLF